MHLQPNKKEREKKVCNCICIFGEINVAAEGRSTRSQQRKEINMLVAPAPQIT